MDEYNQDLLSIMELKNEDSENSPEGGAVCHLEITVEAKEKWV